MIEREVLHKEIDLVQACIARMAQNSFLLKGWMLSVLGGIWAFSYTHISTNIICVISVAIILSFWYLDAYFLRIEKMYRELYSWIINERVKGNENYLYDINPQRFANNVMSTGKTMFSGSMWPFYGAPFFCFVIASIGKTIIQYPSLIQR